MRFCIAFICLLALSACSPKGNGDRSTISLNIPSLSELNAKGSRAQKVSSSSIDANEIKWENACFMVSVTARDLPSKSSNVCEIPSGIFFGSVAPGATAGSAKLSLEVPKGDGRRIAVYAYFRHSASEACIVRDSLNGYNKDRVGTLGALDNVSLQKDSETLDIDISLPTQMLASELSLPVACTQQSATGGRMVSGTQSKVKTVVNGYTVSTSAGATSKRLSSTPNGFKVYRKRGTAQ